MGKKSRKSTKKNRDLAVRRQQQLQVVENDSVDGSEKYDESIYAGDRVFYLQSTRGPSSGEWKRGRVVYPRCIADNQFEGIAYTIQPDDSPDREVIHFSTDVPLDEQIIRDNGPLVPKFNVDEKVVCSYSKNDRRNSIASWQPAIVVGVFPSEEYVGRHAYHCRIIPDGLVSLLEEEYIVKFPPERFVKGDSVLFRLKVQRADGASRWVQGRVVDGYRQASRDEFFSYRCTYGKNKSRIQSQCIEADNDTHITKIGRTPRERLFDAVAQNCPLDHFDFLVSATDIDVSSFRDLFVMKSIKAASYFALLWAQGTCAVNAAKQLYEICAQLGHISAVGLIVIILHVTEKLRVDLGAWSDSEGQGFLIQCSLLPNAANFFETINEVGNAESPRIEMFDGHNGYQTRNVAFAFARDIKGQTMLHAVVASGNISALGCILSPDSYIAQRLAWWTAFKAQQPITSWKDLKGLSSRDLAVGLGRLEMVNIIDGYEEWYSLYSILYNFRWLVSEDNLRKQLRKFGDLPIKRVGQMLTRFCERYPCDMFYSIAEVAVSLLTSKNDDSLPLFKLLYDACPSILNAKKTYRHMLREEPGAFVHTADGATKLQNPDWSDEASGEYTLDVVEILVSQSFRNVFYFDSSCDKMSHKEPYVQRIIRWNGQGNIASALEKSINKSDLDVGKNLAEYRLKLVQDINNLPTMIKWLKWLCQDCSQHLPNVILLIEKRLCGILQWMVSEKHVRMNDPASQLLTDINNSGISFEFAKDRAVPQKMIIRDLLCVASVIYDDYASLEWLLGTSDSNCVVDFHGWNLLHIAAYYGRVEISVWLVQNVSIISVCQANSDKQYPVHLAIMGGFLSLAKYFLANGCPADDGNGRSIYSYYASRSSYVEIVRWGEEYCKERHQFDSLSLNLVHLYELLRRQEPDIDAIKNHIMKSQCLSYDYLHELITDMDGMLPNGKPYSEILSDCVRALGPPMASWLYEFLLPDNGYSQTSSYILQVFFQACTSQNRYPKHDEYDNNKLSMIEIARKYNDKKLEIVLYKWGAKIIFEEDLAWNPLQKLLYDSAMSSNTITDRSVMVMNNWCDDLIYFMALEAAYRTVMKELQRTFFRGDYVAEIQDVTAMLKQLAASLNSMLPVGKGPHLDSYDIISDYDGTVNFDCMCFNYFHCGNKDPRISLYCQRMCNGTTPDYGLIFVIAFEGYAHIMEWFLVAYSYLWDKKYELAAVRIAALAGQRSIVEMFLSKTHYKAYRFHSSYPERLKLATLGAASTGDLYSLKKFYPVLCNLNINLEPCYTHEEWNTAESLAAGSTTLCMMSLVGTTTYSWFHFQREKNDANVSNVITSNIARCMGWLVAKTNITFIYVFRVFHWCRYIVSHLEATPKLLGELVQMGLNVWKYETEIHNYLSSDAFRIENCLCSFEIAKIVSRQGLSIQYIPSDFGYEYELDGIQLNQLMLQLKQEQMKGWSVFDSLKLGGSLADIREATQNQLDLCDSQGLFAIHIAATHNRTDVLEWLLKKVNIDINVQDNCGNTPLQMAEKSNATAAVDWIQKHQASVGICAFITRNHRRKIACLEKKRRLSCIISLQSTWRGYISRRLNQGQLLLRLVDARRYKEIWNKVENVLNLCYHSFDGDHSSWEYLKKKRYDMLRTIDQDGKEYVELAKEQHEKIVGSSVAAARHSMEAGEYDEEEDEIRCESSSNPLFSIEKIETPHQNNSTIKHFHIKLTKEVLKWIKASDEKYKSFFIRRIGQLAAGDQSRILRKSLTGCKMAIYESYLEQKSGQRILWTEFRENNASGILVWYVAKHKSVSRLVRLIDEAESRTNRRRLISASCLFEIPSNKQADVSMLHFESNRVLLDPLGDIPLKMHQLEVNEISKLAINDWQPPMHLTAEERNCVEKLGTVMLLGRSGTGKTICICNRIDYDRRLACEASAFSQLFIARSVRICSLVKGIVPDGPGCNRKISYWTYAKLLRELETSLQSLDENDESSSYSFFLKSRKMDFQRYKKEVFEQEKKGNLDPLIVWTQIRTFIKGSIEAVQHGRPLEEHEYLSLGAHRCRLSQDQRRLAYASFTRYERYLNDAGSWDDCDRAALILRRIRGATLEKRLQLRQDKVYVDEIQDYTQAELAIFFTICERGGLFLAGDTAQSVVEGVDFRFDEVRSVAHHLFNGDKRYIPEKPLTLNINFRSHSGVLNVAAAVLELLFAVFPRSVNKLPPDEGLFVGPKPGIFPVLERIETLKEIVSDGIVVLTHDENVASLQRILEQTVIVLGVRESKGLEFQDIIVVDFFLNLPSECQKPWRLMLNKQHQTVNSAKVKKGFPELESHLKLLYTAITRCSRRLFFLETSSSIAGNSFYRWIRDNKLADNQSIDALDELTKTPDEWRSSGVDYAIIAEYHESLEKALEWLDRAIYCFEKGGDVNLGRKARAHRRSIRFRIDNGSVSHHQVDSTQLELHSARIVEALLKKGLLSESLRMGDNKKVALLVGKSSSANHETSSDYVENCSSFC